MTTKPKTSVHTLTDSNGKSIKITQALVADIFADVTKNIANAVFAKAEITRRLTNNLARGKARGAEKCRKNLAKLDALVNPQTPEPVQTFVKPKSLARMTKAQLIAMLELQSK